MRELGRELQLALWHAAQAAHHPTSLCGHLVGAEVRSEE